MSASEPEGVYSLLASDELAYGLVRKILTRRKHFISSDCPNATEVAFAKGERIMAKGSDRKSVV